MPHNRFYNENQKQWAFVDETGVLHIFSPEGDAVKKYLQIDTSLHDLSFA
jgi:hypothetical protein